MDKTPREHEATDEIEEIDASQFAHRSEAAFARFLSFHRLAWQYEPRTFVLERDKEGRIKKGFTPDFYLPDFDLYVELTTKKTHLMDRKRRQLEALRELHPDVRIQLLDRDDYRTFFFKYLPDEPESV